MLVHWLRSSILFPRPPVLLVFVDLGTTKGATMSLNFLATVDAGCYNYACLQEGSYLRGGLRCLGHGSQMVLGDGQRPQLGRHSH